MQPDQKLCLNCHNQILDSYYFCPNCGKNLKSKPLSTSIVTQIGVYALSILLPPLGLWPGFKYLKDANQTAKIIGWVAIILTIISTIVTTWLAIGWFSQINNEVTRQLNQYQNLGY